MMAVEEFHRQLHQVIRSDDGFRYQDWSVWKSPLDLAVYHEVVWHTRPERIVEVGTGHGGFTLYLAHMLDQLGAGMVFSIDIEQGASFRHMSLPTHPRIWYYRGQSSLDENLRDEVAERMMGRRTMVILDSDHHAAHVLAELRLYAPLVTFMQYLVVEDTDLNHPVPCQDYDPGPHEAVQEWMLDGGGQEFVDTLQSKYLVTSHTWLRRRAPVPPNPYA